MDASAPLGVVMVGEKEVVNHFLPVGFVVAVALAGLVALVYGIMWLNRYVEGRRLAAVDRRAAEIATAMQGQGLTMIAAPYRVEAAFLKPFESCNRGEVRTARNLMQTPAGADPAIRMMEYSYVAWNGQRQVMRGFTAVLVIQGGLAVPHFLLTKEAIFQWAEKLFKVQDINFEEHPKFSSMYLLQGEDEEAVRALFPPALRTALESHPGLTVEGRGSQLLFFREGVAVPSAKWPEFLAEVRALAPLFQSRPGVAGPPPLPPG